MLRRSTPCLAPTRQNGFSIFARQAWKLPIVAKAPSFRAKSKVVHEAWARLSPAAKAKFAAIGKRTPVPKKTPAPLGKWQKFVKANYKSVSKLPFSKRLAVLAQKFGK